MKNLDYNKKDWLKDAVPMDKALSSSKKLRQLVDALFEEIAPLIKVSSKSRQKEALKTTLMNLIRAHQLDKPVRYSRDKNRYTRDRRYGKLYFKYDRLIPIIDALEGLGYIEQSSFYFDHEKKGEGLQTRMWGTDKLWSLCQEYRLLQAFPLVPELPEDEEIIILRDEDGKEIGYRETKQTRQMREDLKNYNNFIDKHRITVRLDGVTVVDNRFLVEKLYGNIKNGKIWIESVKFNNNHYQYNYTTPIPSFNRHKKPFHINPFCIIHKLIDRIPAYKTAPSSPITHTKRRITLLRTLLRRFWSDAHLFQKDIERRSYEISRIPWKMRQDVLGEEFRLQDIGIDELFFVLDYEHLRRIFNLKSWEQGGRAYGSFHQHMLRKYMRKDILIDGQPTTEIDFSAYHIRMLYHRKDIDYTDDPYSVCEGPEMRTIYKAVGLIAINAKKSEACGAIHEELKDRKIPVPRRDEPFKTLVRKFKEAHRAIEQYLFSGIGLTLQNIDSHIMNAILMRLMDKGILGLSVYDSVIVAEQHEAFTKEVMTKEYKKIMGFKPRF
ncbi:MAG: hypothetical protein LWX54_10675 [Deltaproteobacteria bacterium]|jgi:hypothetical protein|nr:hypothetical protein [Deltaproteobacteria bacterium]